MSQGYTYLHILMNALCIITLNVDFFRYSAIIIIVLKINLFRSEIIIFVIRNLNNALSLQYQDDTFQLILLYF